MLIDLGHEQKRAFYVLCGKPIPYTTIMTGDGSITTHTHGDLGLGIPKTTILQGAQHDFSAPARQDVLSCQLQWLNHLTRLVDE